MSGNSRNGKEMLEDLSEDERVDSEASSQNESLFNTENFNPNEFMNFLSNEVEFDDLDLIEK